MRIGIESAAYGYDQLLHSSVSSGYVLAKLCPEDKEQLNRIEKILNKKKQYVQVRINK